MKKQIVLTACLLGCNTESSRPDIILEPSPIAPDEDGDEGSEGEIGDLPNKEPEVDPEEPICGNLIAEVGEQCDGPDLLNQSCLNLGFDGGSLACSNSCEWDKNLCHYVCENDDESQCPADFPKCAFGVCSRGEIGNICDLNSDCKKPLLCVSLDQTCETGEAGSPCSENNDCLKWNCIDNVCGGPM